MVTVSFLLRALNICLSEFVSSRMIFMPAFSRVPFTRSSILFGSWVSDTAVQRQAIVDHDRRRHVPVAEVTADNQRAAPPLPASSRCSTP